MPSNPDIEAAEAELRHAIMTSCCSALHATRLSPITVMRLAAAALGSIYREIATAHRDERCSCGWEPDSGADVEALSTALTGNMQTLPVSDLRAMQVAGQA